MAGKTAPSLLELQKDAIKTGVRNAGGGERTKTKKTVVMFKSNHDSQNVLVPPSWRIVAPTWRDFDVIPSSTP